MTSEQPVDEFMELVQRFVHMRPKLVVPEYVARFKQQMQTVKLGGKNDPADRAFIFRIFIVLAHRETPPTMGELSTELGIPLSSATRIIDGLVDAKFVERINDASDRRVVRVQMTKMGKHMYESAMSFNKQRISHVLNIFTPEEQTQLLYLMKKLFDSLTAEAEKGVNQ
jgi:DNA-binding MarR family transcriptional regulator